MLSNTKNLKFILGSSSARRLDLLKQINFYPNEIFKPEINEDPQIKELGKHAEILADAEGLDAHRISINTRIKHD